MRHPISHLKDSRALRHPEYRIHVSQLYRRMGMTHFLKMLTEDSGFNSPWNALRLPRAKKAFHGFVYDFCYRAFGQKVMLPPHTETLSRAGYLHTGIVDLYRLRYMGLSRYFDDLKLGCIEFQTGEHGGRELAVCFC